MGRAVTRTEGVSTTTAAFHYPTTPAASDRKAVRLFATQSLDLEDPTVERRSGARLLVLSGSRPTASSGE